MPIVDGKIVPFYRMVDGFKYPGIMDADILRQLKKYVPKAGEIYIVSYPKCGQTWTTQLVNAIINNGVPVLDDNAIPFLEMSGVDFINELPEPKISRSHLIEWSEAGKFIFIARNPKDCCVSYYHHTASNAYDYKGGTFEDYFEIFINGENDFGDYFDHLKLWYTRRNLPNVLFLTYEDMKCDLPAAICKIASFLGPQYAEQVKDPEVMANVIHYSSVDYMKSTVNNNMAMLSDPNLDVDVLPVPKPMKIVVRNLIKLNSESENLGEPLKLVRKGIIGDWRNTFSEDQNKRMNDKICTQMAGTELLEFWKSVDGIF